ncbi:RNA polymerase, sigma-24 subunit, ECF subfamily [Thermodesulfobium narugense DSM 14796]|uniref:RNA polymerase, sigma-24 subunit, ECF subfamily n=1 Tax=Thermodesulfobium narugense DSM 14796 TaxID=747365 RepID=M1E924_9BACT|nr:sigma-70 family RNA polymerase sigma factor [Thermodesulfobium narugense]AEE14804.1 RNA polymerase, sigma-24 subunit, ECF subfamily [Thermodesulfobium narugense DSM 14796]
MDSDLILRIKSGDQNAFRDLYNKYSSFIYTLSYRLSGSAEEAKDLVQEFFIKFYNNVDKFDINYPFIPWSKRVLTNLYIDKKRTKKEFTSFEDLTSEDDERSFDPIDGSLLPEEVIIRYENKEAVERALLKLPEIYRVAIVLFYQEELSIKEISNILSIDEGTVKMRISRGRKRLYKELSTYEL